MREAGWVERLLVRLPFSVYLGWISVATIVNATVVLYDAGWDGAGLSDEAWTAGLIGVGAGLGVAQGAGRGIAGFPLVLAWAFSGVAIKNAGSPLVAGSAWAAVGLALASAVAAIVRGRR
jgi:hypothetical protein